MPSRKAVQRHLRELKALIRPIYYP
jgi:hypothetical protein